jgi:hypothetical protein
LVAQPVFIALTGITAAQYDAIALIIIFIRSSTIAPFKAKTIAF